MKATVVLHWPTLACTDRQQEATRNPNPKAHKPQETAYKCFAQTPIGVHS